MPATIPRLDTAVCDILHADLIAKGPPLFGTAKCREWPIASFHAVDLLWCTTVSRQRPFSGGDRAGRAIISSYRDSGGMTDMLSRRDLIALSAAQVVTTSLLVGAGRAQTSNGTYPSKPVRIIVPVAAGGPTDIVARALADSLSAMWHQQVFIENKPGAGNNLGCEYVARSDPDGYTVLFDPGAMAANTSLYGKLSYDAVKDFAPVSLVALVDYFMFVPNSSPAHSLEEFIDYVKSRPGKLTMASPGTGSAPYLAERAAFRSGCRRSEIRSQRSDPRQSRCLSDLDGTQLRVAGNRPRP
jgi:hypothetical protein